MKIEVQNLGQLNYAQMSLCDFTIITGFNNSGKTYMAYALYGFLRFWRQDFIIPVSAQDLQLLIGTGKVEIDLSRYVMDAARIIDQSCKEYMERLHQLFSSREKYFENTVFKVSLDEGQPEIPDAEYARVLSFSGKSKGFSFTKNQNENILSIRAFSNDTTQTVPDAPEFVLERFVSDSLKEVIFDEIFPHAFISSAERTGISFFEKELDFARKKLVDMLRTSANNEFDLFQAITQSSSDYPWPVDDNVEFVRRLSDISKKESFLSKEHPQILAEFETIVGGVYTVSKNQGVTFRPDKSKTNYTMGESASSVRSLLDLAFYLKHQAKKGDLLIIDEPEMNLHPKNQRKLGRLLATLTNVGVKVFITTHSDFIIRELHNLILMNHRKGESHILQQMEQEDYRELHLINEKKLKIYVAEEAKILGTGSKKTFKQTLTETEISDEKGISSTCFDDTISLLNKIEDVVLYGGDYVE